MMACSYSFEVNKSIDSLDALHIPEINDPSLSLADLFSDFDYLKG